MGPEIRQLLAEDAGMLAELRQRALLDSPEAFLSSPEDDPLSSEDAAREELIRAGAVVWGAFTNRLLVGMVGLHRDSSPKVLHKVYLWGLFVAPQWRGRSVGAQLLRAALEHARSLQGVTAVQLSVGERSDAARRLYEKLGFRVWGLEPAALRVGGRHLNDLHMMLILADQGGEDAKPATRSSPAATDDKSNQRSWIRRLIAEDDFECLASGLSGAELNSLLLAVMRSRATSRTPAEVLRQFARDLFCRPAVVEPRAGLMIETELFTAAARFEAIELSPIAPLGACSVLAPTDQNRVLSALRATEVVSDPTNVLALECARRLRAEPRAAIHLACSQRVVRAQPVPKRPGYAPHFRLFALASAGRQQQDHGFTIESLAEHVRTMLHALDRLEARGYAFGKRRVEVLAASGREELGDRIAELLGDIAKRTSLAHGYYSGGLRYTLWVTAPNGDQVPIADGGSFDWVAKLTSNWRVAYVASGVGTQLIQYLFRVAQDSTT
jgi:ribosomal protein S18 acetylase RimI-like enzyme